MFVSHRHFHVDSECYVCLPIYKREVQIIFCPCKWSIHGRLEIIFYNFYDEMTVQWDSKGGRLFHVLTHNPERRHDLNSSNITIHIWNNWIDAWNKGIRFVTNISLFTSTNCQLFLLCERQDHVILKIFTITTTHSPL